MKRLILLVLMLPIFALADPQRWMEKENPNELGVFTFVNEFCPMTNSELKKMVDGVLVRSRIKPVSFSMELGRGNAYLDVSLSCTEHSSVERATFIFMVDFLGSMFVEAKGSMRIRYGEVPAGMVFGYGSISSAKPEMKSKVEGVITDYLKANFDLGEDE